MNLYFGLFCSAGVLFKSSELGFDFFAFPQLCLTKKLEEKTIDSYSSYVPLFGFYTQQLNVNSAANFVFTSKIGLPCVVPVLWPHSRNLNNICTVAIPGQILAR